MLEFLRLLSKPDVYLSIYILLGFIVIYFGTRMWLAQQNRTRSIFALERENANRQIANAFIGIIVTGGLTVGVYYLTLIELPPAPNQPTPTATPLIAQPPTPTAAVIPATPTRTPTPTATPTPFVPQDDTLPDFGVTIAAPPTQAVQSLSGGSPANCPIPGVQITQPGTGAEVTGIVQLRGIATHENFVYYKFEFRAPGGEWSFIEQHNSPVSSGVLGSWNSDSVPPGSYELRLVVVDQTGNYPTPCVIRLNVQ